MSGGPSILAARIDAALEARGEGMALVASEIAFTGLELSHRARALADQLRASGVPRGAIVGVTADRSADAVASILGIIYAGCAYLPVDPSAPAPWRRHLLSLSGVRALLSEGEIHTAGPESERRADNPDLDIPSQTPSNLAYVMGTSGTTGLPKGVAISVASLLHYCAAFAGRVGGSGTFRGLRMASATTLAADLGNTMLFPALLFGGEFHLMSRQVARDPRLFAAYMAANGIEALKIVPTHLRPMLDAGVGALPRRLLVLGGEPFGLGLLERLETLKPACTVFNHYGPTEATIGVAMHHVTTDRGSADRLRGHGYRSVPVGTPLGETQLVVMNDRGHACGTDEEGELVIEGPSVAEGYLAPPGGQTTSFAGTYRSGDRACRREDGLIELRGRIDRQFKLHGHRVEAAGVEEQLRGYPGVVDAVVGLRAPDGSGAMLVAWLQVHGDLQDADLRDFLAARVPEPAVPTRFVRVEHLPRTPNGKVDFLALPDPDVDRAPAPSATSSKEAARRVFSQVLALPLEEADGDFFRLGGNSLAVLRAIALLRAEHGLDIDVEEFYADPTPEAIGRIVRVSGPIAAVADDRTGSVSPQLLALWTHLLGAPQDTTYEVPFSFRVVGNVDAIQIGSALRAFAARHPALRTRIETREGKPFPVVDPDVNATLRLVNSADTMATVGGLALEHGPVVQGMVTTTGTREHHVDMLFHHAVWDGISGGILVRELAAMLAVETLPHPHEIAIPRRQTDSLSRSLGPGARARLGLPEARGTTGGPAGIYVRQVPKETWSRVESRATSLGSTAFVMAAAAWALVLSRQDGEAAVTIGTPADLRDPTYDDALVGYHTNIVVIEIAPAPDDTVGSLVRQAHCGVARAIEDRHRPYSTLVAEQRAATGSPPTRTLLTLERLEVARAGDVEIRQVSIAAPRSVLDLDLGVIVFDARIDLHLHYRGDICAEDRAQCLGDQFVHALGLVAGDPDALLADLDIMPVEWAQRVRAWSLGPTPSIPARWSFDNVAALVLEDPNATALVWRGDRLSRANFADRVSALAQTLRGAGVGPGHVVAIRAPPSPALAVAWHATYAVGAAALGLDSSWPQDRCDAAARLAMAGVMMTSPDGIEIVCSGTASTMPHAPDLAYLVMTSGSTGAPKLVAVPRSALANELSWFASSFPLNDTDCVLAHSSPGFDVCVWEMLGPLAWGAQLTFPALHRRNDVPHLAALIRDCSVTVIQAVPALLDALTRQLITDGLALRLLVSGGEELSSALVSAIMARLPRIELINTYGPSETAIDVAFHRVVSSPPIGAGAPLGRPIAGAAIYVVDGSLRLLPPGAFGQLAIGGAAVGRGYIGDAIETARRFVPDPFNSVPGSLIYLTGDRARWNGDGVLEYGGRLDHQVKVRGNRVELQAIEAELKSLPMVEDAIVHLQYPGTMQARLAALVVPRDGCKVTVDELYEQSMRRLPAYMVPSVFGIVAGLPRLANGKLSRDSAALAAFDCAAPTPQSWQDETEAQVAAVWANVLERDDLHRHLPFFASGGTSLLVPVLQVRLARAFGETLSVPDLFEHCTIAAQAALLRRHGTMAAPRAPSVSGRGKLRRAAYAAREQGRS